MEVEETAQVEKPTQDCCSAHWAALGPGSCTEADRGMPSSEVSLCSALSGAGKGKHILVNQHMEEFSLSTSLSLYLSII